MSELKAYIAPTPDGTGLADYYLKSEADKVIAVLQEKLKEQTSIAEEGWKEFRTYHTSYAEAVKELYEKNNELRHHKYKRCLDKVRWCKDKVDTIKNGYMVSGIMTTCPPKCNPKFFFTRSGTSVGWNLPRNSRRRSEIYYSYYRFSFHRLRYGENGET